MARGGSIPAVTLRQAGMIIRTVQELLASRPLDVSTTMVYLHVISRDALGVKSLMDRL